MASRSGLASGESGAHSPRIAERERIALARANRGDEMDEGISKEERAALVALIERLREEHRDLDAAIAALSDAGQAADRLQLQRLKKRKLILRDKLAMLEDQLTPDIIA